MVFKTMSFLPSISVVSVCLLTGGPHLMGAMGLPPPHCGLVQTCSLGDPLSPSPIPTTWTLGTPTLHLFKLDHLRNPNTYWQVGGWSSTERPSCCNVLFDSRFTYSFSQYKRVLQIDSYGCNCCEISDLESRVQRRGVLSVGKKCKYAATSACS